MTAQPRVFVNVGGKEQDAPTSVPPGFELTLAELQARVAASRMVDALVEFTDSLRTAGLTDLRQFTFAEDDHSSVVPGSMVHGIRFALSASA